MIKRERALVEKETITEVTCDFCEKSTRINVGDLHFEHFSYGTLKFCGGYGSQHDGTSVRQHLCEECLFELVNKRKSGEVGEGMYWGDE